MATMLRRWESQDSKMLESVRTADILAVGLPTSQEAETRAAAQELSETDGRRLAC